jgi:hypothetical protein
VNKIKIHPKVTPRIITINYPEQFPTNGKIGKKLTNKWMAKINKNGKFWQ